MSSAPTRQQRSPAQTVTLLAAGWLPTSTIPVRVVAATSCQSASLLGPPATPRTPGCSCAGTIPFLPPTVLTPPYRRARSSAPACVQRAPEPCRLSASLHAFRPPSRCSQTGACQRHHLHTSDLGGSRGCATGSAAAPQAHSPRGFCFEMTNESSWCPEQQGPVWPSPRGSCCDGGIPVGASTARRAQPRAGPVLGECREPLERPGSWWALPKEGGLLDDTLNWLLLDCTVVAVQDTEEVADEVAITTLFASIKASWKLYKHFFFAAFFFSLQSKAAGASLPDGGGRASGLVSESVGPETSAPSEENGNVTASSRNRG